MVEVHDKDGNLEYVSGTQVSQPTQSQSMDYTQSIGLGKRKYSEISEDTPLSSGASIYDGPARTDLCVRRFCSFQNGEYRSSAANFRFRLIPL